MKRTIRLALLVCLFSILPLSGPVHAETYYFSIEQETVDVYWEDDGTMLITYEMRITNDPGASPIPWIDIGLPNMAIDLSTVSASLDGRPMSNIGPSDYVSGSISVYFGSYEIQPGQTSVLKVSIPGINNVLYVGDEEGYASGLFTPTWFDSSVIFGSTDLTVSFHLPPGIQPDEPRWHESPSGWPQESPQTGLDSEGRVLYVWHNPSASPDQSYVFGASFPSNYVPIAAVQEPSLSQRTGISFDDLMPFCCVGGILAIFAGFTALGVASQRRRKLDYLPPKISIEGHGIKRGLTAVEAAILLETPLDRVLTMILFSLLKKGVIQVTKEDPLEIEVLSPDPEGGLRPYEKDFITAMREKKPRDRQKKLQKLAITLVKAVQAKMKGFSTKESKDYYRSIMKKAWRQVEAAETPEVKSERYSDSIEWTMLDKDFEENTRRTFRTGPVFVPVWWGAYRPSYRGASAGPSVPSGQRVTVSHSRGGSLPSLPGADFAASMVAGVQRTAGGLVSNLSDFTGGVTKTTNPPPPPSKSSGGWSGGSGGSSCACACACAGCACACAGGGR